MMSENVSYSSSAVAEVIRRNVRVFVILLKGQWYGWSCDLKTKVNGYPLTK